VGDSIGTLSFPMGVVGVIHEEARPGDIYPSHFLSSSTLCSSIVKNA